MEREIEKPDGTKIKTFQMARSLGRQSKWREMLKELTPGYAFRESANSAGAIRSAITVLHKETALDSDDNYLFETATEGTEIVVKRVK